MRIVHLDSARSDLDWFRYYDRSASAEGARNAARQYLTAVRNLSDQPNIGRPFEESDAREYRIARTPFSIIYRLASPDIEIMRVWDNRRDRGMLGLNEEQAQLS